MCYKQSQPPEFCWIMLPSGRVSMQKLLRITAVFSVLLVLVVAATVVIGDRAQAGVDPCITVVPTDTAEPGVTETLDPGTITAGPTDTVEVPTDVPTEVPTEVPTDVPTEAPPTVEPTFPFQPQSGSSMQVAGVNQSGNNRVLFQAVDCETP